MYQSFSPLVDPCRDYKNTSGVLLSPGYPYQYPHSRECIYTITVAENHVIKIMFSEFDLEHQGECSHDFLQFAASGSKFSNDIERYCGNLSNVHQILISNQQNIGNWEDPSLTPILHTSQNKILVR